MKYINKLKNYTENSCQLWNENAQEYKKFMKVIDYYKDCINDDTKLWDNVISKIRSYSYINAGTGKEEDWTYNIHTIIVNGIRFEYKTGLGINCQSYELAGANREKIIFDCLITVIDESSMINNYDEDEFINEFGYTGSSEEFKKGIYIYQQIKENKRKIRNIFDAETINNITDIIEL